MFIFAIVIISMLTNLVPAYFVIASDVKSATHRSFFGLTLAFVAFGLINYVSLAPKYLSQIVWIRLDLVSAVYLFIFMYLTFYAFPHRQLKQLPRSGKIFIAYSVFVSLVTLSPLVFSHVVVHHGQPQPVPGPGIVLFVAQQLSALILTGLVCRRKYLVSHGNERRQLRLVIIGTAVSVVLIVVFNLVAVQGFNNTSFIPFSSLGVLAFTLSFSFALIRYKFLGFRLLLVRSLTYILATASLSLVFGVVVVALSISLLSGEHVSVRVYVVFLLATIVIGYGFQPLKRFFDIYTNRIFYRDAYNPELFLGEFNSALANETDLERLLLSCISIIEQNLKASFCLFVIYDNDNEDGKQIRVIGAADNNNQARTLRSLDHITQHVNMSTGSVLLRNEIADGHHASLAAAMKATDVDVLCRLSSQLSRSIIDLGYFVIGPKKTGNAYSINDKNILEIITNELIIAVQNALRFKEIQEFNLTLQNRINSATKKLRVSNDKLRSLDETKDDFISMASHQLRTPLTSVKGYISMVVEGDAGDITPVQKQMLTQAFESSQRMVYLIADLLNVSRLKTGKFVIEPKPVNLATVVNQELAQLEETAKSRQITLTYKQPAKFPELMLDETKIRQVIMNFVDNAIYYTPPGGTVDVRLNNKPDSIELRVEDNGMGVPRSEQAHLFTKFYRAGNARKARPDGTGLGLFMAKKVIIAQGGALIFNSHEGKGSSFGFVFGKNHLAPANPAK